MLARLAWGADGVVTRAQLLGAGVTIGEIKWRLRTGALIPEHPGVYRVGHRAPSLKARYLAAVWGCGDGALLCGRAAGHFFGLLTGLAPPPEVLTPTERRLRGVITRRARRIAPEDAGVWRGVPVTTVPRTLVDLAASLSLHELARACHEAGVRFRTGPAQVGAVLARRPWSPGAAKLHVILRGDARVTLSRLESRFLVLLREATLPLPHTNRPAGERRVDCRWPEYRLTVELDSYTYHHSRHAWEQDRRREREARARNDEFRRYTYGDMFESPELVLAELGELLTPERRRPPAPPPGSAPPPR